MRKQLPLLSRLCLESLAVAPCATDLADDATRARSGAIDVEDSAGLVTAATRHGVSGVLVEAAREERVRLDPEMLRALHVRHAERMVRGVLLRAELTRLATAITSECGISPIVLKGPALAAFYPAPELRTFEDLDLLLPGDALPSAVTALEHELGYRRLPTPWPGNLVGHSHSIDLHRPIGVHDVRVELHWRLSDDPAASRLDHRFVSGHIDHAPADHALAESAATNHGTAALDGCRVASRPMQLLLAAVHVLHHGDRRLKWLIDLVVLGERADEREWSEASRLAQETGLSWVLRRALERVARGTGWSRPIDTLAGTPPAWGPLRVAQTFGASGASYHLGHLAGLSWPERARYLRTGAELRVRQLGSAAARGRVS